MDTLGWKSRPQGEWYCDRESYAIDNAIFGFDCTCGATGSGPLTLVKQGNSSVVVTFASSLIKTMVMVCFMVYDSIVKKNEHRKTIADLTT